MLQQKKTSLLPKTTQINKPVIIVITAILVTIILFAIINALTTTKMGVKNNLATIKTEKASTVDIALNNLPQDYQDTAGLKKYSANFQDQDLVNLQKEMNQLKHEHELLAQQLHGINQQSFGGNKQGDEQAKNSNLFFTGIEPEKGTTLNIKNTTDDSSPFSRNSSAHHDEPNSAAPSFLAPSSTQQTQTFRKHSHYQQTLAVMKASDNPEDIYDLHNVVTPASPYQVQAGTLIPATLITGINTTLVGTVIAQITHNTYDTVTGKFLLIPKGSKILGDYESRTTYGQRRVLLTFNRIIRPDGSSILIGKSTSADSQGQAGIEGNVDNHWGRVIGAATLSTILSVGAGIASDSSDKNYYPDARQRALMGASSGISQVGQNITNRALDIQPTITLPAGYHFNIVVKKDMVISPPYKR